MYPDLWIFDTYSIMFMIGIIMCFLVFNKYSKRYITNKDYSYSILITACLSIAAGIVFATLFQLLFNVLENKEIHSYFSMTFFGGLVGGAVAFILIYFLYLKKKYPNEKFSNVVTIAPACITIAHGFGRIGCFFAGCCYGKVTDSWLGVKFPGMEEKVYPTQLFEAAFLFILFGVLFYLAMKKNSKYTMPIYLIGYGIWRFLIEFIRGDERGAFLFGVISPSQVFSIIAIIIGIILIIRTKKLEKA